MSVNVNRHPLPQSHKNLNLIPNARQHANRSIQSYTLQGHLPWISSQWHVSPSFFSKAMCQVSVRNVSALMFHSSRAFTVTPSQLLINGKGECSQIKSFLFRGPWRQYIYNDPLDKCRQKCQLKMFCCSAGHSNTCQSNEKWKKLSSTVPVQATQTEGNANNPELHKLCSKLVLSQSVPSTTFGWFIESGPMCVCLLV